MGVTQMLSLTVVLLLALYGCAKLMTGLVTELCRPSAKRLRLVLDLQADDPIEQEIRFAERVAKECGIVLEVNTDELYGEALRTAGVLLGDREGK